MIAKISVWAPTRPQAVDRLRVALGECGVEIGRLSLADSMGWATPPRIERVVGAVRHPLNASDFSSFLLQAQSSKAKIIGLANAGGDTINSIKAANEFGITKNQQLAGLLVFITDVHSLGLKTTQGMYLTDGWYWDLNDETRRFGKRFFDKMKKMPSMIHASVYSSTWQYLNAVKATGSDDALEQSLATYSRGAQLLKYCQAQLADAQQKVRILEDDTLKLFSDNDHQR